LCNYLKGILEDDDNIVNKVYKDKLCDSNQFVGAYESIIAQNKSRSTIIPKPTHHIIIPMDEDIQSLSEIMGKKFRTGYDKKFF